jgi:hypothetical protein
MAREQSQHGQHEADHGQGHGQKDEELPDWLHLGLLLGQVSFSIPLVSFFFLSVYMLVIVTTRFAQQVARIDGGFKIKRISRNEQLSNSADDGSPDRGPWVGGHSYIS